MTPIAPAPTEDSDTSAPSNAPKSTVAAASLRGLRCKDNAWASTNIRRRNSRLSADNSSAFEGNDWDVDRWVETGFPPMPQSYRELCYDALQAAGLPS